ncbi:MAG: class I SAM-dependent methyltransferase [Paracoccaceae bacterium]
MSARLFLASEAFADADQILLISPPLDLDLTLFGGAELTIVQDRMPDAATWNKRPVRLEKSIPDDRRFDAALVFLPRSKAAARDYIAKASEVAHRVVVDGQKTDGVMSVLKDMKSRTSINGPVSKSHGKVFWWNSVPLEDWKQHGSILENRWTVVPGVFSANHVDPGSALLAKHLPVDLKGRVADLGAGWGYLAARTLETNPKIKSLYLVEAQGISLDCARENVKDLRAVFEWADATTWTAPEKLDAVIMNPPFHIARTADQDLGRAFIQAAARNLRARGTLCMVANRHLAYEAALQDAFDTVREIGADPTYKIFEARKRR